MTKNTDLQPNNDQQRLEYLLMTDEIASSWLKVFERRSTDRLDSIPVNKVFWDTGYWDLFTNLWRHGEVKKTDATNFIVGKTTPTATKNLNMAIESGFLTERENPTDPRSKLVGLSDEMKQRLDAFFDAALIAVENTASNVIKRKTEQS